MNEQELIKISLQKIAFKHAKNIVNETNELKKYPEYAAQLHEMEFCIYNKLKEFFNIK